MVKAFIRNPAKIKRKAEIFSMTTVKGTKGLTKKSTLIRANNRAVPLNPRAPKNNPKSGNFATKRKASRFG